MARLVVVSAGEPRSFRVAATAVLGRQRSCEVFLDDPGLSREHARVSLGGTGHTVEDLGSRNGTFLNGRPVHGPTLLSPGDQIRLGATTLRFEIDADEPAARADATPPRARRVAQGPGAAARLFLNLVLLAFLAAGVYGFRLAFLWLFARAEARP